MKLRRSLGTRLELIGALVLLMSAVLPAFTTWAQDSGATSFTIASSNGNVVIKRANGDSELARPGTTLGPNDQLASVGRSEATVNLGNQSGGSGATLFLFSNTTIGVRSPSSGGGGFYVADLAQGVVVARTLPNSSATIQITNEHAGAVAQLNRGGMAVATDTDVGTVAVSCDDKTSQVAFPYTDMRVPCESGTTRTLSNTGAIEDSHGDNTSPVTAAFEAAVANESGAKQNQQQATSQNAAASKQNEDVSPPIVASPVAVGTPCGGGFLTFSGTIGVSRTFELGRTSGVFAFSYDGGGNLADTFDVVYEGRSLSGFPLTSNGFATISVPYSGHSSQVTVNVAPNQGSGNLFAFAVGCPVAGNSASTLSLDPPSPLPAVRETP